ncbi:MAG: thioredoxin domain-containing protein, partial [Chloroflexi bacterium]|nr:thioredoxin domain-containing protein [Chloroflexota bacterium]
LVPHFEKMLYDNGLLVQLYVHAWQATGNDFYRSVVENTLGYLEREMLHAGGGFYSALDADSEGEEGKYYVWWASEIGRVLGPELAKIAKQYWAVAEDGNFEGRNILWMPEDDEPVAAALGMKTDELRVAIGEARGKLLKERERRVRPGLDDKVLTSWNALALKGFAEAGAAFGKPHFLEIATRNAEFLLGNLVADGRLLRTWKATGADGGGQAKLKGYLEDYAYLTDALTVLYEATFRQKWLDEAVRLADSLIDLFWDPDAEAFFDTGRDHEQLVVRPRDIFDNATPCGSSAASLSLLRLAKLTGRNEFERHAAASIRSVYDILSRSPAGFGTWLAAIDFYVSTTREIAIIGPQADKATSRLVRTVWERYLPNRVLAGADAPVRDGPSPLLADRKLVDGKPAAYVCENYVCKLPVTDPDALLAQLEGR